MRFMPFDIEAVKNDRAGAFFAQKQYIAPSNWKDEAKIAANIAEQRKKAESKAALHWTTAQVIVICAKSPSGDMHKFFGSDESALLDEFFKFCDQQHKHWRSI